MKANKIIYWIVTILFCLAMTIGGLNFLVLAPAESEAIVTGLGFPGWLAMVIGVAKLLGVIAILVNKSAMLKQLAYFGFMIDLGAAIVSHAMAGDGQMFNPVLPLVFCIVSFIFWRKI